jgi:hypothetical protein
MRVALDAFAQILAQAIAFQQVAHGSERDERIIAHPGVANQNQRAHEQCNDLERLRAARSNRRGLPFCFRTAAACKQSAENFTSVPTSCCEKPSGASSHPKGNSAGQQRRSSPAFPLSCRPRC